MASSLGGSCVVGAAAAVADTAAALVLAAACPNDAAAFAEALVEPET
jgi:hypothetical protein